MEYIIIIQNQEVVSIFEGDTEFAVASINEKRNYKDLNQAINSLISDGINPEKIWKDYPNYNEPMWNVLFTKTISQDRTVNVLALPIVATDVKTIRMFCKVDNDYLFLIADNSMNISVTEMGQIQMLLQGLGSIVDVSDYTERGDYDALIYLGKEKEVSFFKLIDVMITIRDSQGRFN